MLYLLYLIQTAQAGSCSTLYTEAECDIVYNLRSTGTVVKLIFNGKFIWIENATTSVFPTSVLSLSKVDSINILSSVITGTIPTQICSMPALTNIYLFEVSLTGSIPECLFSNQRMQSISIDSTVIGGSIPSLANSNLTQLSIKNSALSGTVPRVGPNLRYLILTGNNLEGTISTDIYNVGIVNLGENKLVGTIPIPGQLDKITHLDLSNNDLSGTVPYMPALTFLDLSYNKFGDVSVISRNYWNGTGTLDLSGNRITTMLSYPPRVRIDVADVDECALKRYICPNGAFCTDGWFPKMSYTCECSPGYDLNRNETECVDIDECVSQRHACAQGMCLNTPGSYECCSNGTYSTGTTCEPCYSEDYVYDTTSNSLPPTQVTTTCFGSCKSGVSFRYRQARSTLCPVQARIQQECTYPCANATVNMSKFDAVNTLHTELARGDYIFDLLGETNATRLAIGPMSITLEILCIECDSVLEAVRIIAPDLVLVRRQTGLEVSARVSSKPITPIVVSVIVGVGLLLLILVLLAMLARDRTSKLHEDLAKTIRVPFHTRLTRPLLTEVDVRPANIENIVSVKRVYNTVLLDNFVGTYLVQKERMSNKVFHKKTWTIDPIRTQVHGAYVALANSFSWNQPNYPTVISVMHGTAAPIAEMIAKTGFAALSTLDSGWYGTGIYFTTSFKYCMSYIAARQRPAIIISYVLPGNVYPVTARADHEGKPLMAGYQSHYIKTTIDGKPSVNGEYNEIVVAQESQILPLYIVEISPVKAGTVRLDI